MATLRAAKLEVAELKAEPDIVRRAEKVNIGTVTDKNIAACFGLNEQHKGALSLQEGADSLRAELAAAKKAAKQAEQDKAVAVAELDAVRQSAAADAQAAVKSNDADAEALKEQFDAALDAHRKAALSLLLQYGADLLRAELVAAEKAAEEAKQDKVTAVAELEAVRKSTNATAQAAAEAHRRALRVAVAEAEGRTAAAVAEAEESVRKSAFAAAEAMVAEFERELLASQSATADAQAAVEDAAALKEQFDAAFDAHRKQVQRRMDTRCAALLLADLAAAETAAEEVKRGKAMAVA
ncbi:hypothetical protein T492DRAFT_208304 [Pavlovales sp. CCMP2436]|nr:hypothetical protein T492DRAFT_208304 [Pavlovales sp. CCMP2436]